MLLSLLSLAHALEPPVLDRYVEDAAGSQVIILLDGSLHYRTLRDVRAQFSKVVDALPDGDRVQIISVGGEAKELLPLTELTSDSRANVQKTLTRTRIKAEKHTDVEGLFTRLSDGLTALRVPPALQVVLMASPLCPVIPEDTEDEEPQKPKTEEPCGEAPDLVPAARTVSIRRLQGTVHAVVTTDEGSVERTQATVASVLGWREVHPVGSEGLDAQIATITDDPLLWKTTALVRSDARKARAEIEVESVDTLTATLNVTSRSNHLSVRFKDLEPTSGRINLTPTTVLMEPNATLNAEFVVPTPLLVFTNPRREHKLALSIKGKGSLEPADQLAKLGVSSDLGQLEASAMVTVEQDLTGELAASWIISAIGLIIALLGVMAPRALLLMVRSIVLFPLGLAKKPSAESEEEQIPEDAILLVGSLVCYAESGRVTGVNLEGHNRMAVKIEVDSLSEGDYNDAQFMVMAHEPKPGKPVFNLAVRDFGYFVNGVMVEPGTYAVEPGAMKIQGRSWSIVWDLK